MFGRVLNVVISIMSVIISAAVKYQLFGIAKMKLLYASTLFIETVFMKITS